MRGRSESSRKNRERLKRESGEQKSDARSGRPGGKVLVSATFVFVAKILLISSCCRGLASNISHLDHYPHIKREKEMLVFHNPANSCPTRGKLGTISYAIAVLYVGVSYFGSLLKYLDTHINMNINLPSDPYLVFLNYPGLPQRDTLCFRNFNVNYEPLNQIVYLLQIVFF